MQDFTDAIREHEPAAVIFDTFARAMAGLDENSQRDTGLFFARAAEVGVSLACAIGIIHHTGKDVSKGSRGSTTIPASCDTVFEVQSPRLNHVSLTMKKQKDWSEWEAPQGFAAKKVADSLVFHPARIQPGQADMIEERRVQAMSNVLARAPDLTLSTKALATEINNELNPESAPEDAITKQLVNWLNYKARTSQPFAIFLAHKGVGKSDENLWRHPRTGVDNIE